MHAVELLNVDPLKSGHPFRCPNLMHLTLNLGHLRLSKQDAFLDIDKSPKVSTFRFHYIIMGIIAEPPEYYIVLLS